MNIIKQYEEDNYIITEYDNGTIEKILKSDEEIIINDKPNTSNDSENRLLIDNILSDLEYIKCTLENNTNI